ncbi:MAG: hypothetical protein ACI9HK_000835, partial [Pirellulaceae bacterium]
DDLHLEPLQLEFLPNLEDIAETSETQLPETPTTDAKKAVDDSAGPSGGENVATKKVIETPVVLAGIVVVSLFFIGVIATASYMFIGGGGRQVNKGSVVEEPTEVDPNETDPGTDPETDPNANDPGENDPGENDPGENEPGESDPDESEPSENEPSENEPSEPRQNEPEPGEEDPKDPQNGDPQNGGNGEPGNEHPPKDPGNKTEPVGPKLPELPKTFFALQLQDKNRVEVQDSAKLAHAEEFTIEMWLRCESKTGTYRCLGTLARNDESQRGLRLHGWAVDLNVTEESIDVLVLEAVDDLVHRTVTGKFSNDRSWHHVALVSGDNELRCFIDGRVGHRATRQFVVDPADARDLCFGAPPFSRATMSFPGQLRALHLASTAFYSDEFTVSASISSTPTTKILWDFEKPKLAEVTDLQDKDNSGRLVGTHWVRFQDEIVVALGDADLNDLRNPPKEPNAPNAPAPNAPDPNALDPNAPDPNAPDPNALDPNALDPNALDPNAPDPGEPRVVEDTRLPVPEAAELKEALSGVAELYRDQIEAAKTTKELAELSRGILVAALDTDDAPVARYAMFKSAADFAARSGRFLLAWKVLDEMAALYQVSVVEEKAAALKRASDRFDAHYKFKLGAKGWIHLVDAAVYEDKYELARRYAAKANGAALRSFDDDFKRYVDLGLKAIKQLMTAYELRRLDQQQTVAELATDEEAAQWGRFLCLYKNQWEVGLELWNRGNELSDPMVSLVQLDVQNPTGVKERISVADQWWQAHEKATDILPKRFFAQRASFWYRAAFADLKGIAQATAEVRLRKTELSEIMLDRGKAVDLVEVMEPQNKSNNWVKRGSRLGIAQSQSRVHENSMLFADGVYELHAVLNRTEGSKSIGISFPVGAENVLVFKFGDQQKEVAGLELIEHKYVGNSEFDRPDLLRNGTQHAIRILVKPSVDRARVKVMWDGRVFVDWEGPLEHLSTRSTYGDGVAVFTDAGNTLVFDRLQLLMISGDLLRENSK